MNQRFVGKKTSKLIPPKNGDGWWPQVRRVIVGDLGPIWFSEFKVATFVAGTFWGALSPTYFDFSIVKSDVYEENIFQDKLVLVANNMIANNSGGE